MGPTPLDLLKRGIRSGEWFHEDGESILPLNLGPLRLIT